MDSILITIKKMLGIDPSHNAFDTDVIIGINSALMVLAQLGVGPKEGLVIKGEETLWTDLLGDRIDLEAAKTFIFYKVRLTFDPPNNSFLVESLNRSIAELESRLNLQAEDGLVEEEEI